MAIVIKRGKKLHIQWYDPFKKKTFSKSTGLISNSENLKLAKQYAKELQKGISSEYKKSIANQLRESTIQNAFDHFLEIRKARKPKTIKDYKRFYEHFKKSFSPDDGVSVINKISYESWLLSLRDLDMKPNSIHSIGKQGNNFLNHLFEYDYIDMFKVNREVKTKPQVVEKVIFTDDELIEIYKNLKYKNDNFQKLIMLMYYTGLRSKDILTIERQDIDTTNKLFKYYNNKRKELLTVPYHNKLHKMFVDELKVSKTGTIINYADEDNVQRAVRRYFVGDLEWLGTKLSPRTFRKTFMTKMRMLIPDATLVQELVGHKHMKIIDIHYNVLDREILRKSLNKLPSFEQLVKWNKQKNKKTKKT